MKTVERKIGLAAFYNALFSTRGLSLAPHHYPIVAGLEDSRIQNFFYLAPPGTGKSVLLNIAYALWELGHDPATTILSVSAGAGLPTTFMSAAMQIIQHNKVWQELFPDVVPAQDMGWSLQRGLFVKGHHPEDQDASYMAVGLSSKALTGLHAIFHIYDDLHDKENAGTPEARMQVKASYYDTLMGRADPRGARRIAAGRWWATDDMYQEWIASGDYVVLELPAVRPGNRKLWYDVYVPHGLECVYSERLEKAEDQDRGALYTKYRAYYAAVDQTGAGFYWPDSPSKRREYETVNRRLPRVAAINYRGDMTGGADAVFERDDFKPYVPPEGLSFGIMHSGVRRWCDAMKGEIEDAWDTAMGQVQSESNTANLTGLLVPCQSWHCGEDPAIVGPCDFHYDLYLLDLWVENIDFGKLMGAFRARYGLWHPRRSNIEEKQSGISLLQVMRGAKLPVRPIKVVEGKLERAVNPVMMDELPIGGGAASVQGWARQGRVRVPAGADWVEDFIDKVCAFKGGSKATDEVDVLVHLTTRAILRSRRVGRIGGMGDQVPVDPQAADDPRRAVLDSFGRLGRQQAAPEAEGVENPFASFCGAPCHWFGIRTNMEHCGLHNRRTTAFDGCASWAAVGSPGALRRAEMIAAEEHPYGG